MLNKTLLILLSMTFSTLAFSNWEICPKFKDVVGFSYEGEATVLQPLPEGYRYAPYLKTNDKPNEDAISYLVRVFDPATSNLYCTYFFLSRTLSNVTLIKHIPGGHLVMTEEDCGDYLDYLYPKSKLKCETNNYNSPETCAIFITPYETNIAFPG